MVGLLVVIIKQNPNDLKKEMLQGKNMHVTLMCKEKQYILQQITISTLAFLLRDANFLLKGSL